MPSAAHLKENHWVFIVPLAVTHLSVLGALHTTHHNAVVALPSTHVLVAVALRGSTHDAIHQSVLAVLRVVVLLVPDATLPDVRLTSEAQPKLLPRPWPVVSAPLGLSPLSDREPHLPGLSLLIDVQKRQGAPWMISTALCLA